MLLKQADVLEKKLSPARNDRKRLKSILKSYTQDLTSIKDDEALKSDEREEAGLLRMGKTRSGFNNQLMMHKVEEKLQLLAFLAPNTSEMIYETVIKTL